MQELFLEREQRISIFLAYRRGACQSPFSGPRSEAFGFTSGFDAHSEQYQTGHTVPQPEPTNSKQEQLWQSEFPHPEQAVNTCPIPQTEQEEIGICCDRPSS
jgi:hypothetical protein